ncbi:MarR family winged helix-turn-helix transcriptional regulator [Clostridium uliginosum]|uniref:DNA-binding transcriptional regulator, MarR family n=1 Tax=Clostridium uliginosum TaxID=119641 RepID=A0A1I1Q3S7_9CLOT|nr:MarR family transcriptional regulator [Clostridium uliginosum]SFD16784.1 DNA-binding transcriptional regulator, MarR family [Clostridium uliginosum]
MNLFGHKANQLARSFTKKLNEKISPLGLYASQWGIILYLYEKKQCTQIELSQYLGVEAPTITRTLARMEEMGWVIREAGNDKRERHIKLTEKACDMFPQWYQAANNIEIEAINDIDKDELEIFNNILEKMRKNLD